MNAKYLSVWKHDCEFLTEWNDWFSVCTESLTGCVNKGLTTTKTDGYRPDQIQDWQALSGSLAGYLRSMFIIERETWNPNYLFGFPPGTSLDSLMRTRVTCRPFNLSDTAAPSRWCYRCDRWPCELLLFLTLLQALHIRKRNSSAACKKELCVCVSRGQCFPWPKDSCWVGGSMLSRRSRQDNATVRHFLITLHVIWYLD